MMLCLCIKGLDNAFVFFKDLCWIYSTGCTKGTRNNNMSAHNKNVH
jgi:hypothetical protein